jgi:hypothetical protein
MSDTAGCIRPEGHEWQRLTRHTDPDTGDVRLANAICVHCSELAFIPVEES